MLWDSMGRGKVVWVYQGQVLSQLQGGAWDGRAPISWEQVLMPAGPPLQWFWGLLCFFLAEISPLFSVFRLLCLPVDLAQGLHRLPGAQPHPLGGRGSCCRGTSLSPHQHGATRGLLSCMAFYSYVIIHPTSYRD